VLLWGDLRLPKLTTLSETAEVETTERFLNPWVTLLGQAYFIATLGVLYFLFKDVVPDQQFGQWRSLATVVIGITLAFTLAFMLRQPRVEETIKFWRPLDRFLPQLFDIVIIAAIFLLFPFADTPRTVIFTAYCIGYVPMQILSDPENTLGNQISTVGLLGAFALQLILMPGWHTDVLAGLVVCYGALMVIAARSLRTIVRDAVGARREVERTAAQLEEALQSVSAERDARTRFLAAASHDLGQPLHAATLFLDNAVDAKNKIERHDSLARANRAIENARTMVGDMLSHARLEADAVQPNLRMIGLNDILNDVCLLHMSDAYQSGIVIKSVSTRLELETDAALLKRALSNLLGNAIRHSQGSKVLIGARRRANGTTEVIVADNGVGVVEEDKKRIFEDFYQSPKTKQNTMSGFGLGLASVERIAGLLGGSISVFTLPTGGCIFLLVL
jgi:two-component system, sensor histidine kinase